MSYLVCYKCDVYYEVENEEEARQLIHCECGERLVYFENLEDSYTETVQVDEPVSEVETKVDNEPVEPVRESIANGSTFTEKKADQYKNDREKGNLLVLYRYRYFHSRIDHWPILQLLIFPPGICGRLHGRLRQFYNRSW